MTTYKNVGKVVNVCGVKYITCTAVYSEGQEMEVTMRETEYNLIKFLQTLQAKYGIKESSIVDLMDKIDEDCYQRSEESKIE